MASSERLTVHSGRQVDTASDVTLSELRVGLMYPGMRLLIGFFES